MILQIEFPKLGILAGIIIETVIFTACCIIVGMLLSRYRKSKKQPQGSMAYFFILYSLAIGASIIGKIVTFFYESFDINKTEWGVFTNWSISLGFIAISLYYQLEVAWQLFPPKIKNYRLFARLGSGVLFLITMLIPRYDFDNNELTFYPVKFILVFIYVLAASLYYMIHSYKVYTFIRNKFLQRRILAGIIFHSCIILVFVFFMISSIYGNFTGIYYSWGYFISVSFMFCASVFGYLYVRQGKESDRQAIDEELERLLQDKKDG